MPFTNRRRLFYRVSAAALALLVVGLAARIGRADIIFTLGNNPQKNEENILFGASESGTTITGATQGGIPVLFSSTTDTLMQNAKGQADIFAQDGLLNNVKVQVQNGTYTDLIINPQNGSGMATVTVSSLDSNGNPEADSTFTYSLGNGQNFLTIVATNGEVITSTTIDAASGFDDLKQPRISGASQGGTTTGGTTTGGTTDGTTGGTTTPPTGGGTTTPPTGGATTSDAGVPEPTTFLLTGLGLAGIAFYRWRAGAARKSPPAAA
ncbi:MAG TPA: PEP-CTERM sorting domain-containing protein [Gemmataceae bacterium]|nr:PEP-CTERM sorting domain-containing protein [Gemmataceae bacterium]